MLVFMISTIAPAMAEERIALVIGNGTYAQVASLDNAGSDAELMAQRLVDVGFNVTLLTDATEIEMKRAVTQFGRDLRSGGDDAVGLFYYAGHGVQSFGANYLLPVDASLTVAADLDLVGLDASSVLRQMASARNRTNIVILDACRNNPFTEIPDMDDNGLAEMKAPTGTFLSYATAPGAVALDGASGNSPFTAALAEAMLTEDTPIEQVFKDVRVRVIEETRGVQTPWDTSSLTRDFVFVTGEQISPEEAAEERLWKSVQQTNDPIQYMLFLRSFPSGRYQEQARQALNAALAQELNTGEAQAAAPTPAPAPEPPAQDPKVTLPTASEAEMVEIARTSGKAEDYQAYLDAYPDGVFAGLAQIEIAAIEAQQTKDPERPAEPRQKPDPGPAVATADYEVFFDRPLEHGVPEIVGKTIMEVATSSPLFSPIDGLPEEMWKNQTCSNCHQWTRDDLCAQAKFYNNDGGTARALRKEHPFGGTFKRNLRVWADGGCR